MNVGRLFRGIFNNRKRDAELDEEIAAHLRLAAQDRIERGESRENARFAAAREFGNAGLIKENTRAVWTWSALEQILQDLRSAARIFTRSPGLCAASIAIVALGIGGNATVFSAIHGILTKPAPCVQAEGLVTLEIATNGRLEDPENSYLNYLDYAAGVKSLNPILARGFERFTLTAPNGSYAVFGAPVTANYFDVLGVHLIKGRAFTRDESLGAAGLVAIISYRCWQNQFQGAPDILGRAIVLNGHAATIVGVAPPRFRGTQFVDSLDVWTPLLAYARLHGARETLRDRASRSLQIMGRLAPGFSLARAQAEIDTISTRLQASFPKSNGGIRIVLAPYSTMTPRNRRQARLFLAILSGVGLLALLIVCANVANLMLARAFVRQREMAVRQSLGASRGRVLRMLLLEGFVLSLSACAAAWIFALWASHALPRLIPPNSQGVKLEPDFTPDWGVFTYAMALGAIAALAFTVGPALRAWKQELLPWLKAGEQGVVQGRSTLSRFLVVAQLAFAVVLLTSAGLACRSLSLIDSLDLHVKKDRLLLITLNSAGAATAPRQNLALLEELRIRLRHVPGITSISYARAPIPFSAGVQPATSVSSQEPILATENFVGPDYLATLGMAPLLGHEPNDSERPPAAKTVAINENLASALWPRHSAVGQTLLLGPAREPFQVSGIIPNSDFGNVLPDAHPKAIILAESQDPTAPGEVTFYARYAGNLDFAASALRAAIHDAAPKAPVSYIRSMDTQLSSFTAPIVLIATLLSVFAIGSLLIAAIGLYAVIAFNMARRTRDFGVRMALGASSRQVLDLVFKEGMLLTAAGLAFGFICSFVAGRAFRAVLFGIAPTDPPTYLGVFCLLALVASLACYLPARRAARIDPMQALRQRIGPVSPRHTPCPKRPSPVPP